MYKIETEELPKYYRFSYKLWNIGKVELQLFGLTGQDNPWIVGEQW